MTDLFGNKEPLDAIENDLWYTPPYVHAALANFFGAVPFDPCPINPEENGLEIKWKKDCFINPPYSRESKRAFIKKGLREYSANSRFIWLVNYANSEDLWDLHQAASAICIPKTRIRFIPGHSSLGDGSSPRYDSIFILWGATEGFYSSFHSIGAVYAKFNGMTLSI